MSLLWLHHRLHAVWWLLLLLLWMHHALLGMMLLHGLHSWVLLHLLHWHLWISMWLLLLNRNKGWLVTGSGNHWLSCWSNSYIW